MKRLFSILTIFLFFAVGFADVERKYDRFTKKTTVSTKPVASLFMKDRPFLCLTAEFKDKPSYFHIMFITEQDDWEYLSCHMTYILADDLPVKTSDATHEGSVQSGSVIEFIMINLIPLKSLDQLCKAKKIEVKICNDVFELDDEEKQDLKDFKALLNEKP